MPVGQGLIAGCGRSEDRKASFFVKKEAKKLLLN
jgi:hypothetical protein